MRYKKIILEYEKFLKLPRIKSGRQIMICPVGPVGAGKTTIIKPLSKKLHLLRISTDEIRKILKEHRYNYEAVHYVAYYLVDKYAKKGFNLAIDANCSSCEAREKIKELKNKYRITVFWIRIKPPEKFIINKLKNYRHTWLFRNAGEAIENYINSKAGQKNLNLPFIFTFNTAKKDIDRQIEDCAERILAKIQKYDKK